MQILIIIIAILAAIMFLIGFALGIYNLIKITKYQKKFKTVLNVMEISESDEDFQLACSEFDLIEKEYNEWLLTGEKEDTIFIILGWVLFLIHYVLRWFLM